MKAQLLDYPCLFFCENILSFQWKGIYAGLYYVFGQKEMSFKPFMNALPSSIYRNCFNYYTYLFICNIICFLCFVESFVRHHPFETSAFLTREIIQHFTEVSNNYLRTTDYIIYLN